MEEKLDMFECGLRDCMTDTAIEVELTRGYDLNKLLVCNKGKEVCTLYDYLSEYFGLLEDEILKFVEETFGE